MFFPNRDAIISTGAQMHLFVLLLKSTVGHLCKLGDFATIT